MRWLLALCTVGLFAKSDADSVASHAHAASALMESGDYAAAERENRIVVRLAPLMAEAEANLGITCFLQKHYSDALVAFGKGLRLKPALANARLFSGMSEFKLNHPAAAAPLLERYVKLQPGDFQGQYYLGLTYLALERFSEARSTLETAARIDSRSVDAFYHLAQTYLEEGREHPAATADLAASFQVAIDRISEIDPNSFRLAQLRAGVYEAEGKKTEAMSELEKIFQDDPKARGLHYTLGCLYMEQRDYGRALEQFQAEQRLDSPYLRTNLQLGHVYLALGKPLLGLPYLERALKLEPGNEGAVWVDLGRAYRLLNQPQRAVMAYEKAIAHHQQTAAVYYQLAIEAKKAGDSKRSGEALVMSQKLRMEDEKSKAAPAAP